MAEISERLLGAGASAKNDWAHASAATSLEFTGEAQIRRGVEVAIGINALASADAGLSKFIDATVRGNAFAEAQASLQLQLPLNLFDEFGVRVGAQAVAQAAAGIEVGLGLSVGDFIALLGVNSESQGLPVELVKLLLDEATMGGKFEVHVAASAMAYASIVIAGKVVDDAGFHITADAGLGLAAGVGFSGGLDIGIRDFRKFYGRAVDRTLSCVVDGIEALLPPEAAQLMPTVRALAPVAATSLRVAYELGDFIAKNSPPNTHQGALDLSNHCVGIILEEAQRFLFNRFLESGLRGFQMLITTDIQGLTAGAWDAIRPQRLSLANVLYRIPDDPFQPTQENAEYWTNLIGRATDLIGQLPVPMSGDLVRGLSIVFAATELLTESVRNRVNQAQSYAFAIGAGQVNSPPSFDGPLTNQPGSTILAHMNGVLGHNAIAALTYADLVLYLASDVAVGVLRSSLPDVDEYLGIFQTPAIGGNLKDVLRALLQNRDAFVKDQTGRRDPQATLRALVGVLDSFITIKINENLVPAVAQHLADGNEKLYFNEVLIGTLFFTKNVAFQTVLDWEKAPVDRSAFTEALAGCMTMLLGRSLVLVGDGFMAALQAEMQRACMYAAGKIEGPHDPFAAMGIQPSPELKALLADTLRIGGEVFGPLPDETRRSLRYVLYDVMESLPPSAAEQASFADNLRDQFFIPNSQSLHTLSDQLLTIARSRFQLFVQRVLEAGASLLADAVEEFIQQITKTVENWVKNIEGAIQQLSNDIVGLGQAIQQLMTQAQQLFAQVGQKLEALIDGFANQGFRNKLRQDLAADLYQRARTVLAGQFAYQCLPQEGRRFVEGVLRDLISDVIQGPILDPILNAIGGIADELDSVVDDVRGLNPNQPLEPQLLDLLLDRMEDRVRDAFGSEPHIDLGFDVNVAGLSLHFGLGRIDLPFDALFTLLRNTINTLAFYENLLNAAANSLDDAFTKSLSLDAKQAERNNKQSDHGRLSRIRNEYTSTPKTVVIVSPVQSLVYDDDVDVQIQLGGVPASYLGLNKDEQMQVLILLNGELIPPQALALDQPFGGADSAQLLKPLDVNRLSNFDPALRTIAGSNAQITLMPTVTGDSLSSARSSKGLPLQPSLRSLLSGAPSASSEPAVRQSVKTSKGGSATVQTDTANVLPGRRMTNSKLSNLESRLPSGTTLQFHVDRSHLVVGTNTLMVVVIDPGVRYQQVVSFGVTVPAEPPGKGVARLPVLPGKAIGQPVARPNKLDLHLDKNLIAQRLKQGQGFVDAHSVRHLRDFH